MSKTKKYKVSEFLLAIFVLVSISGSSQEISVVLNNQSNQTQTQLKTETDIDCMADAIYYEAGHESELGKEAVGRVVLNRVRHGFSKTVCGVVNQGQDTHHCQFSFRCTVHPIPVLARLYNRCRVIAKEILKENLYNSVVPDSVLFFRAVYVHPKWPHYEEVAQIGNHVFYVIRPSGG